MTDRELMQHALECLEWHIEAGAYGHDIEGTAGLLRALLAEPEQGPMKHGGRPMTLRECMEAEEPAQPEQEPVACVQDLGEVKRKHLVYEKGMDWEDPLYTAPSQRQWQGLTDEERNNLWRDVIGWGDPSHDDEDLMKAIEAKLKEKNT